MAIGRLCIDCSQFLISWAEECTTFVIFNVPVMLRLVGNRTELNKCGHLMKHSLSNSFIHFIFNKIKLKNRYLNTPY